MKNRGSLVAAAVVLVGATVSAQQVVDTSKNLDNGERVLQQSIIVNASSADVWQLLTTADGLRKFAAPNIQFELRAGALWASSFDTKAKLDDSAIHNKVVSFVPGKMLSIQVGFPAGIAEEIRRSTTVFAVTTIESLGPKRTRVVETMSGFGPGAGGETTLQMFKTCNQQTLEALRIAAQTGRSINWQGANPYSGHQHDGVPAVTVSR